MDLQLQKQAAIPFVAKRQKKNGEFYLRHVFMKRGDPWDLKHETSSRATLLGSFSLD